MNKINLVGIRNPLNFHTASGFYFRYNSNSIVKLIKHESSTKSGEIRWKISRNLWLTKIFSDFCKSLFCQ